MCIDFQRVRLVAEGRARRDAVIDPMLRPSIGSPSHAFRQFVCHVVEKYLRQPELLADELICRGIESQLLDMLIRMMPLGHGVGDTATILDRRSKLCDAIAFVNQRKQPITVRALATGINASQRQLERHFREALGITPEQYLQRVRMSGAHHDLCVAEAGFSSVTEIGNDWGFTELGRFAVEYKRLFGESPSETLRSPAHSASMRLADALSETLLR